MDEATVPEATPAPQTLTEQVEHWFQRLSEIDVLGLSLANIVMVVAILFIGYVLGKTVGLFLHLLERRWKASNVVLSLLFKILAGATGMLGLLYGAKFAVLWLDLPEQTEGVVLTVISVLLVLTFGWIFFQLVDLPYTYFNRWAQTKKSKMTLMVGPMLRTSLRCAVILLTFVQLAQVISNQPITSIIAGLGIGGLAFALAAQDSLKHLFGSLVIFADRPFEVGDRLVIDGHDGPVEEVGFRSTRIRNLDGHLVTIPNGELVNKNIQNIGKRPNIRRLFRLGVTYDTPPEKLKEAMAILNELLSDHEGMDASKPPRIYFENFSAASLDILVIYWYHPAEYWDFMLFSQNLNLEILRRFNEAGIDFAFPSQTLYLAGDDKRPLEVSLRDQRGTGEEPG